MNMCEVIEWYKNILDRTFDLYIYRYDDMIMTHNVERKLEWWLITIETMKDLLDSYGYLMQEKED